MRFELILVSVKNHLTDDVVDAAKEAGATGATIIPARGTGVYEAKTFFGLSLESKSDIVMFLVEEHVVGDVLDSIETAGHFDEPGTGIAFVLPVKHVRGLESQMKIFREQARDQYL
jgi:nitrogen regulatory protein PII